MARRARPARLTPAMRRLVLASSNTGKLGELRPLLADTGLELVAHAGFEEPVVDRAHLAGQLPARDGALAAGEGGHAADHPGSVSGGRGGTPTPAGRGRMVI